MVGFINFPFIYIMHKSYPSLWSFLARIRKLYDTDIASIEEVIKIVEDETEKKKDVERSTRLGKRPAWTNDYIM